MQSKSSILSKMQNDIPDIIRAAGKKCKSIFLKLHNFFGHSVEFALLFL